VTSRAHSPANDAIAQNRVALLDNLVGPPSIGNEVAKNSTQMEIIKTCLARPDSRKRRAHHGFGRLGRCQRPCSSAGVGVRPALTIAANSGERAGDNVDGFARMQCEDAHFG